MFNIRSKFLVNIISTTQFLILVAEVITFSLRYVFVLFVYSKLRLVCKSD